MKVAIVHDWLTAKGGAEKCLEEFLRLFPDADLFCVVDFLPEADRGFLQGRVPQTSFIQRLPRAREKYRTYLPLMPLAIEQFDLAGYDLVISSSYAVAKGVITGPDQLHISYTHSPIRYAWDLQGIYLRQSSLDRGVKSAIARLVLHYLRMWDTRTGPGVDHYVSNSRYVARRIAKLYRREATTIHPPVDVERFVPGTQRDDFYLTVSRMVPYKCMPMIAEAFRQLPDRRLVVIGDGPDMENVQRLAGPNVEILGRQPDDVVRDHMQRAKAFIFAAEEDFGIVPIEAQACGTPAIAYGRGGATETVIAAQGEGRTGVFFHEQSADAIARAVEEFEGLSPAISRAACRRNAERFSAERFREEFGQFVRERVDSFLAAEGGPITQGIQRF